MAKRPRKDELLEPKLAAIGAGFLKRYIELKKNPREPVTKLFNGEKKHDYNVMAVRLYRVESYKSLPDDCKSFIGRCAAKKKEHPSWTFEQTVNQELHHIEMQAERLYASVKDLADEHQRKIDALAEEHYRKVTWPEEIIPMMVYDWYVWAEKNPNLAYVSD